MNQKDSTFWWRIRRRWLSSETGDRLHLQIQTRFPTSSCYVEKATPEESSHNRRDSTQSKALAFTEDGSLLSGWFLKTYVLHRRSLLVFALLWDPTGNSADAVKEAEQRYLHRAYQVLLGGSIVFRASGCPVRGSENYPKANAGIGCVSHGSPLRERQEEYAAGRRRRFMVDVMEQGLKKPFLNVILSAAKNGVSGASEYGPPSCIG